MICRLFLPDVESVSTSMSRGRAAEPETHRHHGFEVVNMESEADDLQKKHDEGYQMDHEEVETLFKNLDKNNDGRIDVNELAEGLKHLHGSRYKAGQAQVTQLKSISLAHALNSF